MNYYYADEQGRPAGPFTAQQLRELRAAGKLDGEAWLIEEGASEWRPFDEVLPPDLPDIAPADPPAAPAAGARHAFISHSSRDHDTALRVCEVLEGHGLRCWIAPRDIDPGAPYDEEIIRGIEASHTFILLLSEFANASPHVKRELMRALRAGHAVYPIRIQEVEPGPKLEYLLEGIHWVDAWTPPIEAHLDRLAALIAGTGGEAVREPAPAAGTARPRRRSWKPAAWAAAVLAVLGGVGWGISRWQSGLVSGIVSNVTKEVDDRLDRQAERKPKLLHPAAEPPSVPAPTPVWAPKAEASAPPPETKSPPVVRIAMQPYKGTRVSQTSTLSWLHDPAEEKRYPSSAQVIDEHGAVIGEVILESSEPVVNGWIGETFYHSATLTFRSSTGATILCVYRHDEAVSQVKVGSAEGLYFSGRVTEIRRQRAGTGRSPNTLDRLTVQVTATSFPQTNPGSAGANLTGEPTAPIDQTIQLNWVFDQKAEKTLPSSAQLVDGQGNMAGELRFIGGYESTNFGVCRTIPLVLLRNSEELPLCTFRIDDAVGQRRGGKAADIAFDCRVTEIKRNVMGYAQVGNIESMTIEVTAKRP